MSVDTRKSVRAMPARAHPQNLNITGQTWITAAAGVMQTMFTSGQTI